MTLELVIERSVAPLDRVRRAWFRLLAQRAYTSALLSEREKRIAFLVSSHAVLAAWLAVHFPVHLFVLGPVLLGVPHVAADVRYLVLRQNLPAWWRGTLWAILLAFVALAIWGMLRNARLASELELELGAALVALAAFISALTHKRARRAIACVLGAALFAHFARLAPNACRIALLHGHNLAAGVLLSLLFKARGRARGLPWLVVLALALAMAAGIFYRTTLYGAGRIGFGTHVFELTDWVAPGLRPDLALGLTSAFVFLQSVHYLAWLVVIPQREQRGEGTLTFRMSVHSLLKDFGAYGVGFVILLSLLVPAAALVDAWRAQRAYLSLANFHAHLELASLAYFWVRAQRS